MADSADLEKEIDNLKGRNKRVEFDKAWETSFTRRLTISILTYIVAIAWLYIINESSSWLKAIVPVVGYILSTLSIPQIKKIWAKTKIQK